MGRINWVEEGGERYFMIKSGVDRISLFQENTTIYTHSVEHRKLDHIFVEQEEERGYFIWRSLVEKALGEGGFEEMSDEMTQNGYIISYSDQPEQQDVDTYEATFGTYAPDFIPHHEDYITSSVRLIDEAWLYYSKEWSNL